MKLPDVNVWLALVIESHQHHAIALRWWEKELASKEGAYFCRSTQQGFLRLLTTAAVFAPYGLKPKTQREAWKILRDIMSFPLAGFASEPEGVESLWEKLSTGASSSPKLWMDAYLAALAIRLEGVLVTFDSAFLQFESRGLRLEIPAAS